MRTRMAATAAAVALTMASGCHRGDGGAAPIDAGFCSEGVSDCADAGSCESLGGRCVGVGACGRGVGHLGLEACGGHDAVCCYPEAACGGAETFECCGATASFRPSCVGGELRCAASQTRAPLGGCAH